MSDGIERLSILTLDTSDLVVNTETYDIVCQLIPQVMEQLASDTTNVEDTQHPRMVQIANETKLYLESLQVWKSSAESIIDSGVHQTVHQNHSPLPPNNVNSELLEFKPVVRGQFHVRVSPNDVRYAEGIYDNSNGNFFLFDRHLKDTIYGDVFTAISAARLHGRELQITNQKFAIKSYIKENVRTRTARSQNVECAEDPIKELAIQQYLGRCGDSPYVMKLLNSFEDERYLYAVLPLAGAELFDHVANGRNVITEHDAKVVFRNCLKALVFLKKHGIAHRDISPENFLTGSHRGDWREIILIDFGLAIELERNSEGTDWKPINHTGFRGKNMYAAPEIHLSQLGSYSGPSIDLWSTAVTIFVVLFRIPLWNVARRRNKVFETVIAGKLMHLLQFYRVDQLGSPAFVDLLSGIFKFDPKQRLSLQQVHEHEWVQDD